MEKWASIAVAVFAVSAFTSMAVDSIAKSQCRAQAISANAPVEKIKLCDGGR